MTCVDGGSCEAPAAGSEAPGSQAKICNRLIMTERQKHPTPTPNAVIISPTMVSRASQCCENRILIIRADGSFASVCERI